MHGECTQIVTTPTRIVSGTKTTRMTDPFVAVERAISVGWASSDLSKFFPASAPLLEFDLQEPRSSSYPGSNPGYSKPSGLSTSAKAGISIGVLCVCVLSGILILLLRRARRHYKRRKQSDVFSAEKASCSGAELSGQQISEAHGHSKPAEADSSHVLVELDGGWYRNGMP